MTGNWTVRNLLGNLPISAPVYLVPAFSILFAGKHIFLIGNLYFIVNDIVINWKSIMNL